jgi:hypothetical protein
VLVANQPIKSIPNKKYKKTKKNEVIQTLKYKYNQSIILEDLQI